MDTKRFKCNICGGTVAVDPSDRGTVTCGCGSLKISSGTIIEGVGSDVTGKLLNG